MQPRGWPQLGERCDLAAATSSQSPPAQGDAYLLSHVIHDWDDDRALTILRNCREAMSPDGKLLLVEMVVPAGGEPHPAKMLDVLMLILTGGMERTEQQYAELLEPRWIPPHPRHPDALRGERRRSRSGNGQ